LTTAKGTRAAQDRDELLSVFEDRDAAGEVLRKLINARLLMSGEREVEVTHESLLSAWPRLVRWQAQDAEGAVFRDQLRQAAMAWRERGRPDDLLWTGTVHRDLAVWRERYPGGLTATEQAFAEASTRLAGRKRRWRQVALASLVAASVAVAAITSSLWSRAKGEALRAEASKLLALAELRLQQDPTEALAFATASLEVADSEEARVFVMRVLYEAPPAFELVANSQGVRVPAFSPDGKWLATTWGDPKLRLWPLPGSGTGEVRSLNLPEPFLVSALAFDPKGRYLFVVGNQGRAWIVPLDGSAPRRLQGFSEDTLLHAAALSPSGRLVATAFWYGEGEKTLRVWDLETGELRQFELPKSQGTGGKESATGYEQGIVSLHFTDESTLYTAGDGGLRRWNLETGAHEVVAATRAGYMVASFIADTGVALTAESPLGRRDECPGAMIRDLTAGTSRELREFGECNTWRKPAVAGSGTVVSTGSFDGVVRVGRLSGGKPYLLIGHEGPVDRIEISPDLRWVATTGEDNTLRLWPMPDLSKPPLHALPKDQLPAKLHSLTNLRAVRDASVANDWKIEVGPFPGGRTFRIGDHEPRHSRPKRAPSTRSKKRFG
jgi:WD40 repeat protein